jgi:ribosome-associated heat shock protein Hsp15
MGRRAGKFDSPVDETAIRLDKWIWFARFLRARDVCADLVRRGRVRVNGRKVSQPGASIRIGDVLTLALPGSTLVVEVLGIAERRAGVEAAASLYRVVEPASSQTGKID